MSSPETFPRNKSSNIYHDIYDFSILPISLGDLLMWGVKSALRASAAGRDKVHVHLICDPQKSGFSPLQTSTYLVDLFVVEALPAFYSHPLFSGLTLYRSRDEYRETFAKLAKDDDVASRVYRENEARFKDRANFDRTCKYFNEICSYHGDINEHYRKTGTYPKVRFLEDCLVDWQALQSQFPRETFWVPFQFRLRKLDSGMPVISDDGVHRDAPFLTWYNFISEAHKLYPHVRFITIGRLQEKPLELLRLPNVIALRTLGMNLAHEITALLNSDLYMGSQSGFAAAAHFSDVPYHIFNCSEKGCIHYDIPFGSERLVNATERQRLHYGAEDTGLLLECLKQALEKGRKKVAPPGKLETKQTNSTDRFFISDDQSATELVTILSSRLRAIASSIECGEYAESQAELRKLRESFPDFAPKWPDYTWLSGVVDRLLQKDKPPTSGERDELLIQVSRYCHPSRLIRRSGRYIDNLFRSSGFRRDGWCEPKTKLVFAPGNKGDFLVLQIARLAGSEPTRLTVRINQQEPVPFVLLNEPAVLEVPILDLCIPTEVVLEADRSGKVNSRDEKEHSFQIEGGGLASARAPMPTFFRGDKSDPREKLLSGIYSNGGASSLTRMRLDNPYPEDTEIMVSVVATLPRTLRRGQNFRIRVNSDDPHEALVSGKYLTAKIPCSGRPRHVSLLLQFWNRDGQETEARENRAIIKSIDILPATVKRAEIQSGFRSGLTYLVNKLKTKANRKFSR